jgi:hypothetical protein
VAAIVLVGLGVLSLVRDNRRAVGFNFAFVALGFAVVGLATLGRQVGLLGPVAWMIAIGAGIYMAYTPFNGMLFDRLIAATGQVGTAGFLIYVADSCGYIGSVSLLLARYFAKLELDWSGFLAGAAYGTSVIGVVGVGLAWMLLRLPKAAAP